MNFIDIMVHSIPRIVFEPYMILGLSGAAGIMLAHWKKYGTEFYCISAALLFMYAWRVAIQIVSSRYAALLAMPMVLLSLAAMALISLNMPSKKIRNRIFALTLIVFSIIGCIKIFRPHPYSDFITYNCRMASADMKENPSCKIIDLASEIWRIQHYTGRKITKIKGIPLQHIVSAGQIKIVLEKYPQDVLYFFCNEKKKGGRISAGDVGVKETEWKLISTQYCSAKKKTSFTVYRYKPEKKGKK